jgi:hypothetical protein
MSINGGIDWNEVAAPLINVTPFLGLAFCLYIALAVLCVLNIVTGVFVENANQITARDEENVLMEELTSRKEFSENVAMIFHRNEGGTMQATYEDFRRHISDPRISRFFEDLGVDIGRENIQGFFELLDFDGNGILDLEEFVVGLQKIHGKARSIDVAHVLHDIKSLNREVADLKTMMQDAYRHDRGTSGLPRSPQGPQTPKADTPQAGNKAHKARMRDSKAPKIVAPWKDTMVV